MASELTEQQLAEAPALIHAGRRVAEPYGSMHPLWDPIFDLEALVKGHRTVLSGSTDYVFETCAKSLRPLVRGLDSLG